MALIKACPICGHVGEARVETPGGCLIEGILWLMFLVPGLIYSIWRLNSRRAVCASCGARTVVDADSPEGRRIAERG